MRQISLCFLCLLFFSSIGLTAGAQPPSKKNAEAKAKPLVKKQLLKNDSTSVNVRSFDEQAIKHYRSQKDFIYDDSVAPELSLWDKFWGWFWRTFQRTLSGSKVGPFLKYIFIATGVVALVFVAMKFAGADIRLLSRKSKTIEVPYEVSLENIHEINFDEQLEAALQQKNYRLAVRLLYLKSLKHLSDSQLIDWKLEKTNQAYVAELANESQRTRFKQLTNQFEYVWYGEFFIDETSFSKINTSFQQFNDEIR